MGFGSHISGFALAATGVAVIYIHSFIRHACRDPSLRISTQDPCRTPRLGSSAPEVIDLNSAVSTLLPRPPLQSTSIVDSEDDAVDLDVSDCSRARGLAPDRCHALPEDLVLPASTSLDAARPTPVPS